MKTKYAPLFYICCQGAFFRQSVETRDYVACGTAAGIATGRSGWVGS